ncbi:MAG: hypothetical protein AAB654_02110, partial [Acidobacteriota bacterium]
SGSGFRGYLLGAAWGAGEFVAAPGVMHCIRPAMARPRIIPRIGPSPAACLPAIGQTPAFGHVHCAPQRAQVWF